MENTHLIHRFVALLFAFAVFAFSVKAQEVTEYSIQDHMKIVAHQFEKWQIGTDSFFSILSDDVQWTVSGTSPASGVYEGRKDFMERAVKPIVDQLKEPLRPELISLTTDNEFIWLHFKAQAEAKTAQLYQNIYIWKLQLKNGKINHATAFLDTHALTQLLQNETMAQTIEETQAYLGMWVTKDGYIRQELLPNNRYDEARGNRQSAYQGSYKVVGNEIYYKDDTGFTADGEFVDENTLNHGGYVFYKQKTK